MLPPATEELADRLIASSLFWDTETSPRKTSSEPTFSIFHSLGVMTVPSCFTRQGTVVGTETLI